MSNSKLFILLAIISAVVSSCGSGGTSSSKGVNSKTGWGKNDNNGWFFTGATPKKMKPKNGMVYVEGGTFTMGLVKDDVMHDWNNTPRRMQVRSFFIGETEVTNYEYREYLAWLKYVFPPEVAAYRDIYSGALPDTLAWGNKLSRNDFYINEYLNSPNFDDYPVIGVTWLQAVNFCNWLTDRANERQLIDDGVLPEDIYTNPEYVEGMSHFNTEIFTLDAKKIYGGKGGELIDSTKIYKQLNVKNPNPRINYNAVNNAQLTPKFRLPTEAEWEYAALALADNREYNLYQGKELLQDNIRQKKGRYRGDYMANFKQGQGDYSGIGGWPNDGSAVTAKVKAYPPNAFGLYGMYGNVAEWVADVYRPEIDDEASDFNYFRGNVYKTKIKNGEGGFETYHEDDLEFDTLNSGQLVYRGLPGQLKYKVVEDASSYKDGDYSSSLDFKKSEDGQKKNSNMYNAPKRQFLVSEDGEVKMVKDNGNRTTDISDEVRVVKGGSWRDGIYWLDPGLRRYQHQAQSSIWVGFRVAQDYMGAEGQGKKTRTGQVK